jgi:HK97 family phage portal protein
LHYTENVITINILDYILPGRRSLNNPATPLDGGAVSALLTGGSESASGVFVSEESALSFSAVYACVRVVSEDIAKLPKHTFLKTPTGKQPDTSHPAFRLLHRRPNPKMSSFAWFQSMQATVLLWGNAYSEIIRDQAARPVRLVIHHPRTVKVVDLGETVGYIVGSRPVLAQDMIHISGLGFDGINGKSVISFARDNIGAGLAAENFGAKFYRNGANLGGSLKTPNKLSDTAYNRIRESWAARYGGLNNAHKTAILEEGLSYESIGIPPNDAQFIETRQFARTEIAAWFRVPPHKIQDLSRSTNNNIEHQSIEYVADTLLPWVTRWEQELEEKLFSEAEKDTRIIKFNLNGLLRGDAKTRAEFYSKMFQTGVYSQNMILELEDENTIGPEGDRRFIPVNMMPADKFNDFLDGKNGN